MVSPEELTAKMQEDIARIDHNIDRLHDENKRMRSLLSQAALFIACQPENAFRTKWLKAVEELCGG